MADTPPTQDFAPEVLATRALTALGQHLDVRHPGWAKSDGLAERARDQSAAFTTHRAERVTVYRDEKDVLAYLAYFAPRAIAAWTHFFQVVPPTPSARVLDVGAGPGASGLVLAQLCSQRYDAVEPNALARAHIIPLVQQVTTAQVASRADIALGHYAQSADAAKTQLAFSFALYEAHCRGTDYAELATFASFRKTLIVDAGEKAAARHLGDLRAEILAAEGSLRIDGPCVHQGPCPALMREGDWCHLRAPKELPAAFAEFAERVGRSADAMSYSALALTPADGHSGAAATDAAGAALASVPTRFRIMAPPRKEKGRARVTVCGDSGIRHWVGLKRHRAIFDAVLAAEPYDIMGGTGESKHSALHLTAVPTLGEDGS